MAAVRHALEDIPPPPGWVIAAQDWGTMHITSLEQTIREPEQERTVRATLKAS